MRKTARSTTWLLGYSEVPGWIRGLMGFEKKVTCNGCDYIGSEDFRNTDHTHTCPRCGSTNIHLEIMLSAKVRVHERLVVKARHSGQKKPFKEVVSGADLDRKSGKWMEKRRVIDRDNDSYEETVVNPVTGKTIHKCRENLSKHRGHGSAKKK